MPAVHPQFEQLQADAWQYQWEPGSFAGRIIMVTGAGDGIGRAAALALGKAGATVILLGRTQEKLEQVYDQILAEGGAKPAMVPANLEVTTAANFEELAGLLMDEFGHLDGLLHNASVLGDLTPLDTYGYGTWDTVMQVNVNAAFYLTRALLPLLRAADHASVVFTSSSVGRQGRAFWGAYAVSKFATEGLMQVLADELENTTKVRVNSLNPGGTRTRMRALAYPGEDPQTLRTPEQILPVYMYLLGAASVGITGQAFDAQPPRG